MKRLFAVATLAVLAGQIAAAQTAPPRPRPKAKSTSASTWTPDVQQVLGVSSTDFKTSGLNKLSSQQLTTLLNSARLDPKKHLLTCAASTPTPGMVRVYLTVAGDDSTGAIAPAIHQAVSSLSGVLLVDTAATADRALNVVLQEQTIGKRTIGFTASYLTGTPCTQDVAGRKADVELKGTLGTYTDAKGPDLARDLAGMLDQDLQPLRTAPR